MPVQRAAHVAAGVGAGVEQHELFDRRVGEALEDVGRFVRLGDAAGVAGVVHHEHGQADGGEVLLGHGVGLAVRQDAGREHRAGDGRVSQADGGAGGRAGAAAGADEPADAGAGAAPSVLRCSSTPRMSARCASPIRSAGLMPSASLRPPEDGASYSPAPQTAVPNAPESWGWWRARLPPAQTRRRHPETAAPCPAPQPRAPRTASCRRPGAWAP